MGIKTALEPFLNKLKVEMFAPMAEKTMAMHFTTPPPNSLEPVNVWKGKIRRELTDLYSGQAAIDKTCCGFEAITEDLRNQLSSKEFDKINEEWKNGVERWISLMEGESTFAEHSEIKASCLQDIMGISEETLVRFYEAGNRYFNNHDFEKASDAFYVMVSLDHRRYNAWIALGLSEVHNKNWDPALYSFAMATINNADSPYPYMYSAECCLHADRTNEAKIYLSLAREALEKSGFANKQALLNSVMKLHDSLK